MSAEKENPTTDDLPSTSGVFQEAVEAMAQKLYGWPRCSKPTSSPSNTPRGLGSCLKTAGLSHGFLILQMDKVSCTLVQGHDRRGFHCRMPSSWDRGGACLVTPI